MIIYLRAYFIFKPLNFLDNLRSVCNLIPHENYVKAKSNFDVLCIAVEMELFSEKQISVFPEM